jgi:hypothetical protein
VAVGGGVVELISGWRQLWWLLRSAHLEICGLPAPPTRTATVRAISSRCNIATSSTATRFVDAPASFPC